MRRLHWIFAIVVVTAFASAFLAERSRRDERPSDGRKSVVVSGLEGPALPRGTLAMRGFVLDRDGRPAADVRVQARPVAPDPDAVEALFFDRTGADGAFELRHLRAGAHRVLLLAADARAVEHEVAVPAPEPLVLRIGEPWGELPAAPDVERIALAGRIARPGTGDGESALAGFEVVLEPRGEDALWRGAQERRATTDAAGRFAFDDVALADHDLYVLPPWARGGSWPALARRAIDAEEARAGFGEEARELVVPLAVGVLEGRLRGPTGLPIEGALLRYRPVGAPPEQAWPAASSDAEGRFVLADLPAGSLFTIEVTAGAARRELQAEVPAGGRREVSFGPLETR